MKIPPFLFAIMTVLVVIAGCGDTAPRSSTTKTIDPSVAEADAKVQVVDAEGSPKTDGKVSVVSLEMRNVSAEYGEDIIFFHADVTIDNAIGRDLAVRSNFYSVFDGLQLVVTSAEGKILAQRGYTSHQSPATPWGRDFPLNQGKTEGTLVFPIDGFPKDVRSLKVRLVGPLRGSGYDGILSSESIVVEVKDRPR